MISGRSIRYLVVALALAPATASGAFNLQLSVKWEGLRFALPQQATVHDAPIGGNRNVSSPADPGAAGTSPLPSNSSFSVFQRRDLNATLGIGVTDRLTILLGLDIARATLSHEDSDASAVNHGFTTFGFSLGVKFNFTRPGRSRLSPYVMGDFFKYFSALNDDHTGNLTQGEVEFSAGLASPLGFRLAFGVEYYFTENFALGADILGLQGIFSSGSMQRNEQGTPVDHTQSLNSFAFYSALTLNFRFTNLFGSSRAYRPYRRRYRDRDRDRGYRSRYRRRYRRRRDRDRDRDRERRRRRRRRRDDDR